MKAQMEEQGAYWKCRTISTEVDIWSAKSYKPLTEVSNTFSNQKELLSGYLVQPILKLKFGRPKCRSKFENCDSACLNQDSTVEIQSERLHQKHVMPQ